MKQCPVCKNTYTDDSLSFCLSDGTRLNDFYEAAKTEQLPAGVKPTEANYGRVNIPVTAQSTETRIIPPVVVPHSSDRKGCSPMMVALIFGLLGIFAVAGISIAYFVSKNNNEVVQTTPTATPAANVNSKEQELKDKLDKLQKQLDEQKKSANKTPPPTPVSSPSESSKTAQVNSPGDGFLAMRSGPSHKTGSQVMKIPDGATVNVYSCQGYTTISGKTGRWCQVSYGGYNGWAFDAWLVY